MLTSAVGKGCKHCWAWPISQGPPDAEEQTQLMDFNALFSPREPVACRLGLAGHAGVTAHPGTTWAGCRAP